MKVTDPRRPVTSAWLTKEGHRLDAPPYLSGAVEARVTLDKLRVPKQPLRELTRGYNGGIYNGPQFKRNYVTSPEHGVPFLTGSSILLADTSRLPMLSKKDAMSKRLSYLRVEEGMTLISCSGSIGKMAYARPELADVWASQDVMKVVPNPEVIPPGYLYAYLSSRYGKTLVMNGTYGAIIQHIEPEHIADLQVPRFGDEFEQQIHSLVSEAAHLRSLASIMISEAVAEYDELLSNSQSHIAEASSIFSSTSSESLVSRMDASFHSSKLRSAISILKTSKIGSITLEDYSTSISEAPRLKRLGVEKEHGLPFFGTSSLFDLLPEPSYYLNARSMNHSTYLIGNCSILIPRSGQVQGIIGRPVLPQGEIVGGLISEHAIRVDFDNMTRAGYAYIALASKYGQIQLKSMPFGSSIPTLNPHFVGSTLILNVDQDQENDIGGKVISARDYREKAIQIDAQTIRLVEDAIAANHLPLTH